MPNWCSNEVSVSGSQEVIAEILRIAPKGGDVFQMSSFIPVPEELEGTNAPQDKPNWYDWSVENWGTKWDMCDVYMSVHPSKAGFSISYNTAWAPNTDFWQKFSNLYPVRIDQRYVEEGMSFIGEAIIENGMVDDYSTDITTEIYIKAGAILDESGHVDWEVDQEYNLFDAFPLTLAEAFLSKVRS
jgi:hypothetical protein